MTSDTILAYLNSQELATFINGQARVVVLVLMLLAFIALLLELRLPVRLYWNLPAHSLGRLLVAIRLRSAPPVWGTCTDQQSGQPLPLVAVELLDAGSHKVLHTTYSDNQGLYGFPLKPGRYLVRATKNNYTQPSFLNPENIEVKSLHHAFVAEVTVLNHQIAPLVDLSMNHDQAHVQTSPVRSNLIRYSRMLLFQLGHLLLLLVAAISLVALWSAWDAFYAIILALCVLLLFIKLFVLQMIGALSRPDVEVPGENHA